MSDARPDVAILGGGMAGLTAAWRLTDPEVRDQVGQVTIYERGARLGGKAASHRGKHGRIEEHGLHVWLGYYDNAFRLIRECYQELDRPSRDPGCPIGTWRDAFEPAPRIGLEDFHESRWSTWTALFPPNDRVPGEPLGVDPALTITEVVTQATRLLGSFMSSLGGVGIDMWPTAALTASNEARRVVDLLSGAIPALGGVSRVLGAVSGGLTDQVQANPRTRRLWHLIDVISAQLRGIAADDITTRGFRSLDHLEYRDWIGMHGATEQTRQGVLVSGLYDLAFSHRGGDRQRKAFPAGLGLILVAKTFFDYRGALFWKMTAGMGETVIAPLYQALRDRGVRFEFFHRVDDIELAADCDRVDRVRLGRQVRLAAGVDTYDPLVDIEGLACFVDRLDRSQLEVHSAVAADGTDLDIDDCDLASHWCEWPDRESRTLERGVDFDELVLAIPPGMGQLVTRRLAERNRRWATMMDTIETIGTQSMQLWLTDGEAELGWHSPGATLTSYVDSFDTYASMTHLLEFETWPDVDPPPKTVAYFCSSMPVRPVGRPDADVDPVEALGRVRSDAVEYLENHAGHYWPNAVTEAGFRWELLAGTAEGRGPDRIDSQYLRANVDPSDQYVQAMPGTDAARLRPDDSGFEHLHLAGDWTDCGLNAGCIEATVMSGIEAANSILGLPRGSRVQF